MDVLLVYIYLFSFFSTMNHLMLYEKAESYRPHMDTTACVLFFGGTCVWGYGGGGGCQGKFVEAMTIRLQYKVLTN